MGVKPRVQGGPAILEQGKRASVSLSEATEELNAKLGLIEQELVNLQLGVTASVEIPTEFFEETTHLKWGKHGNVWGLLIQEDEKVTPIQHVSRDLRLKAADCLEALITELLKAAAAQTEEVRRRVDKLDSIIANLQDEIPF